MPLLALSNELLDKVFEHCDTKSVKSARLANRRLKEIGNRHLLRELPLYYNQESLDRLDALTTTHQDMAKGIRALWFQADRLERHVSQETWNVEREKQYDEHSILQDDWVAELSANGLSVTTEPPAIDVAAPHSRIAQISRDYLHRRYNKYTELYAQQCRLDQSDVVREKCAAFFRVCPQLSSIWITSGGRVRRSTTHESAAFREGLVAPCFYYDQEYDANVHIASQILLGSLDAGLKLDTLVLGRVNYRLLTQGQPQISKLAQVLQHVRHLQWDVGETFVSERDPYDVEMIEGEPVEMGPNVDEAEFDEMHSIFETGHFSTFIANATNLKTLVINMPELGSTQLFPVDFVNVVGTLHFPHLRSFSLTRVTTNVHSLVNFLLRHKDTLTDLRLCDLYMIKDADSEEFETWDDFFRAIAGRLPLLEKVCLRGGFYDASNSVRYVFGDTLSEYIGTPLSRDFEAYMIHGGEHVPTRRADFRGPFSHERDRTELMEWAGEAIVPQIRPIGWDISWET